MNSQETPTTMKNLTTDELVRAALARGEAVLAANGALSTETGKRTGRSPKDRFIVRDSITDNTVDWGSINQPIAADVFSRLWQQTAEYLAELDTFEGVYRVGEHSEYGLTVRVTTETAWHQLFAKNLFIESDDVDLSSSWHIMSAPNLHPDPEADGVNSDGTVMINFTQREVLIIGMPYAGEMKKSMFSILNFLVTEKDVLPMHCAANAKEDGSNLALFFGLSGTGKTTLSADPERFLIGDDEHGWSECGVFNFEGGCYAKCIDLSQEREPVIWQAIRHGTIMENVVLGRSQQPDYSDATLTQNSRAAYPLSHIEKRVLRNAGDVPSAVIFLTCDLYGVLPPLAKLTREQAAYYFLSGYTALVGSTEMGSTAGIRPTFSTCFGAPFFPRAAKVYADLLMKRVDAVGCPVYLVNTGWTGGAYGAGGERFSIPTTRAVVRAIIDDQVTLGDTMPGFGFQLAASVPGVANELLNPIETWSDPDEFARQANKLIAQLHENFERFDVSPDIQAVEPQQIPVDGS